MKMIQSARLLGLGLTLVIAAIGCQTKHPVNNENIPGHKPGDMDVGSGNSVTNGEPAGGDFGGHPLVDPGVYDKYDRDAEIFKSDAVHFDFDSAVVKSDEKSKIANVADHLKSNPSAAVEVDGNCDERGTEEYNRSLGERRALAIREELIALGIDPKKIPTQTFGKDKPVNGGHDEAAWKENRRGDFILLTPPKANP